MIYEDILAIAKKAAMNAGQHILQHRRNIIVNEKEDQSLVTQLDRDAENIIVKTILNSFPEHSIFGEESASISGNEFTWIIDPIDGTHNFIRGMTLYGISVGVTRGSDFIAGVVYLPDFDRLFAAAAGLGATVNDRPLASSNIGEITKASIFMDASVRYEPEKISNAIRKLSSRVFNIRMMGSTAYSLTTLASNGADGVVEFTVKPWDFAGSVTILQEAGVRIEDLYGGPIRPDSTSYIAAWPGIFSDLSGIIREE